MEAPAERTQRIYARLAGILFLWLIINGLGGVLIYSHIGASGTFAQTAQRIVASERLYRVALFSEVIETLSVVRFAAGRHPDSDILVISIFGDEANVLAGRSRRARAATSSRAPCSATSS